MAIITAAVRQPYYRTAACEVKQIDLLKRQTRRLSQDVDLIDHGPLRFPFEKFVEVGVAPRGRALG